MKKLVACGIISLFIVTAIVPSAPSTPTHGKHIITVDNEPGDADYTSIREALSHSNPGDTIEVFSGTYYEYGIIVTQDGISLIGMPYELGNGNDTGKPFINGTGISNVVTIEARNATVSGFRIENKGAGIKWLIVNISSGADYCTLSNNTLSSSNKSIIECLSNFSTITNNTIRYAFLYNGITFAYPGHHNVASDNAIDRCPTGICFLRGENNTIVRNRISNCSGFGVAIYGATNFLRFNTFENNYVGIDIYQCTDNIVKENNFIHNYKYQASFGGDFGVYSNRWIHNYWGRPRLLPYPIPGDVFYFYWWQFDWRPALQPFKTSTLK